MKQFLATLAVLTSCTAIAQQTASAQSASTQCQMAQQQLKRVQALLKDGKAEHWGRNLVEYQTKLFDDIDKECFPDNGINAQNKNKRVVKKQPKQASQGKSEQGNIRPSFQQQLGNNQIAEIGPASSFGKKKKQAKGFEQVNAKSKAWQAWYSIPPECIGKVEMKQFVWCNNYKKAKQTEFDDLWKKKNNP